MDKIYHDASLGFEAGYTLKKKALLGGIWMQGMGDSYFMRRWVYGWGEAF